MRNHPKSSDMMGWTGNFKGGQIQERDLITVCLKWSIFQDVKIDMRFEWWNKNVFSKICFSEGAVAAVKSWSLS